MQAFGTISKRDELPLRSIPATENSLFNTVRKFSGDKRARNCTMEMKRPEPEDLAADLMNLFLPVHYRIGVGFEETLRCGQLSRKQVAILWLMRAEGGPDGSMRRKDIERLLALWFETSSSTITRSLAALARAPLKLVRVREDPDSGREKRVVLTVKGEQFLASMAGEGRAFTQKLLDGMPRQEIRQMVCLMQKAIAVLERDNAERNSTQVKKVGRK
jgi:DNA-binding MarR family transcriptional regulator